MRSAPNGWTGVPDGVDITTPPARVATWIWASVSRVLPEVKAEIIKTPIVEADKERYVFVMAICREVSPAGPATNEGQNVQSITVPLKDFIGIPGELVLDDRSLVHEFLSYCPEAIGGIVGSKQTVACYVFRIKKHLGKSNSVNSCEKMNSDGPTKIWDIQGVVNYESQNLKTLSWYRLVENRVVHRFLDFF